MFEYKQIEEDVEPSSEEKAPITEIVRAVPAGDGIISTPINYKNMIIFGALDGHVYALNATTGSIVWKFLTGERICCPPSIRNNTIYIGSYDKYMYAINADDGALVWRFLTGDLISCPPTICDNRLYFTSADGYFYCLYLNGKEQWKFWIGDGPVQVSAVSDDFAFCTGSNRLYAIGKQGQKLWSFLANGPLLSPFLSKNGRQIGSQRHVDYGNGNPDTICIGSLDGYCYAVDGSGNLRWKFYMNGSTRCATLVGANGVVYFGSTDQNVYALRIADGKVIWKTHINGEITCSGAIYKNVIYFGATDDYLYALDVNTGEIKQKFYAYGSVFDPPYVVNDVVYVGTYGGKFFALSCKDMRVLWEFTTGKNIPPKAWETKFSRIQRIVRWVERIWKPEKPVSHTYEPRTPQTTQNVDAYKSEVGYKSNSNTYQMQGPAGYTMQQKKKDPRDPFAR